MKFSQQSGKLIISDMAPGDWPIDSIAEQLTKGDQDYYTLIREYNGLPEGEPYADILALPVAWLNDAGMAYYNSAGPSQVQALSVSVSGTSLPQSYNSNPLNQTYGGFKVWQLALLGVGAVLVLSSLTSPSNRR